jgi:hypothetical protein
VRNLRHCGDNGRSKRAIAGAVVLLVLLCALAFSAPAFADGGTGSNAGGGGNANGVGNGKHDPCTKKQGHIPAFCQSAPEAPAALVYPAAAGAVLIVFWSLERRRRRRHARIA